MSVKTATVSDAASPVMAVSLRLARGGAATATSTPNSTSNSTQDIEVQLQYLRDDPLYDTVKPLQIVPDWADTEGKTNVRLAPGPTETIHDVRGREGHFSLDANGFSYVKAPTNFKEWSSQQKIGSDYLPELESLLRREVTGCDEILFYDARLRQETDEGVKVEGLSFKPFARQVHRDNTDSSVNTKIRNLTEMKADYLMSGRARIINIWRPIKHPVYDCGLAIADGGQLQEGDILECDRVRKDTGEFWDTMGVAKFRPGFGWWYMSEQDEADVLLFKNYDSATDVKARHCLHTAFDLPPESVPPGVPTRESIEVRALVFTHPANGRRPSGATQHPLAASLQQGCLKRIDDEPSITDRLRTDIDEGHEVKDAMLLLRKREIYQLERVRDTLVEERERLNGQLIQVNGERDQLRSDLDSAQKQIRMQTKHVETLQAQVQDLQQQLQHFQP